ncbi:MAG: OmpA family protein [Nonlabens sp.]|uniref:OmpA family protein n=1 Tax=Nonlabens sp. TaxID=1888209 RepID=UPI003EF2C873
MKKFITLSIVLCSLFGFAQDTQEELTTDFKRWSIDLGAGVHKPSRPFSTGYTDTPDFWQADLGLRYNFTRSFGLGLEVGYNNIQSSKDLSTEFESDYLRVSLEGIVNLGNFVGLKDASSKFGILGHGGLGVGMLSSDLYDDTDLHLNFMAGITPQYRISSNLAVFTDLTVIGTMRNNYGWDGAILPGDDVRGFEGMLVNASVGLTYYFGKGDQPADFTEDPVEAKVEELAASMDKMAKEYADDDKDGVPNYIDRDNTTESGVRVDNKGRAIDVNKNGIPDDMESALDGRYASKSDLANVNSGTNGADGMSDKGIIKKLINEGYVNVYFQFNSTKPALYSLSAINTLVTYMKDNPSATATLTGYADELGSPEYNKNLSERRAKMVHDVLVASGVSASRLSHNGNGEDASVDKNSSEARQLVRRVTFRVN